MGGERAASRGLKPHGDLPDPMEPPPAGSAPSLAELRAICLKKTEAFSSRVVYRRLSIPITWLLVRTPVSPNAVSWTAAVLGTAGIALLLGTRLRIWAPLLGLALLQAAEVLDHVDGEVARAKRRGSPGGYYLDNFVVEVYLHVLLGFATAWVVWRSLEDDRWLYAGALFALLKAINLASFFLKGFVALKYPPSSPAPSAPSFSLRAWMGQQWWNWKCLLNWTLLLFVLDAALTSQGILPIHVQGWPVNTLAAYVGLGVPVLAISTLRDAWASSRGRYAVDLEPYK